MGTVSGKVWVFGDYVSTDEMYPNVAFKSPDDASSCLFKALRPTWHSQVQPGDVIVGGRSFGIGSARPVATRLREVGVAAVLAESISSVFLRGCLNGGLLAIPLPGITGLCEEGDQISIDVGAGVVTNERTAATLTFAALPPRMQEVLDAGGVLELLQHDGYMPVPNP